MAQRFRDRAEAGRLLASLLHTYAERPDVIVLALPRGGVPVGFEVALALRAPLDVFVVRKLGVPGHEELAFGAVAGNDVTVIDRTTAARANLSDQDIASIAARERTELDRREATYREDRPPLDLEGKIAIITDDGLATGATMRAALIALRDMQPAKTVLAVPVASPDVLAMFEDLADDVVAVMHPEAMYAIGMWYDDFSQTSDDEVRDLLARARLHAA